MSGLNHFVRYSNHAVNISRYLGEGYIAYTLAFADMATNGSIKSLATLLTTWGFIDGLAQMLNFYSSFAGPSKPDPDVTVLLHQKSFVISRLCQFFIFIGEQATAWTAADLLSNAEEKKIEPDYNFISSMWYITFAAKAGLELISSIKELHSIIGKSTPDADLNIAIKESTHIKIAQILSSACELGGWIALAQGNSLGWVGLAAAVSIKVLQVGYTRVSIHGLFGEKTAKTEDTNFLVQPSAPTLTP